jgi:hypothetical protein
VLTSPPRLRAVYNAASFDTTADEPHLYGRAVTRNSKEKAMYVRTGIGLVLAVILTAVSARAQDATVVGTVTDESKAVMPGVTVTATDPASGRQIVAVTNQRGEYRLVGLPPSRYTIQAELTGFASTIVNGVELLVGQNAAIGLVLKLASVAESVTVTGESPLVDTRQAQVAGNVDRRQMEDLPINGRNWMQLTSLVKGVTANSITTTPGVDQGRFQLNLDGQEITQGLSVAGFGQPGLSRDAIAEYQVVTNLFDVSMGRSSGLQVQAITKSGTNNISGSTYGFLRSDKLNDTDFFANRVLPYSNQQLGGTLGGPIIKDKLQYFAAYEYEREPNTAVVSPSPYAGQQMSFPTMTSINNVLGRVDQQLGNRDHLLVRSAYFRKLRPVSIGNSYPTQGSRQTYWSNFTTGNWARIMGNGLLQEVKAGFYHYGWLYTPMDGVTITPTYTFPGLSIGPPWNYPDGEKLQQDRFSARYDLTWHHKRHDLKIGGEYLKLADTGWWMARARGEYVFSRLPADTARRFPLSAWSDPSQWDLGGLDSSVLRYDRYYAQLGGQNEDHGNWSFNIPRPTYALWIGDTWTVSERLTLNLGVRYDLPWGDLSPPLINETDVLINNGKFTENAGFRNGTRDLNNVAPRVGFAWNVTGRNDLVIRGGTGIFSATDGSSMGIDEQLWNGQRVIVNSYVNDGKPGFIQDPTRGVTADDVISGKVPLAPQNVTVISPNFRMPYTWQSILGFQKQLSDITGFDADLVYWKGYNEETQRDANVFYDPVTGFNKNPTTFGRPNRNFGPLFYDESRGRSDYMAMASSFTRRYRNRFQLGLTYTLMFFKNNISTRYGGYGGGAQLNPFDLDLDWGRATDFQHHTLRANGIWNLPYGLTLAGFYQYGSGNYSQITSGVNPTGVGATRIRSDLSLIPKDSFHGDPIQRLDLRLSKDLRLAGKMRVTGIAEVFNLYNYASYTYNVLETSSAFGRPNGALVQPRSGQLGLRLAF